MRHRRATSQTKETPKGSLYEFVDTALPIFFGRLQTTYSPGRLPTDEILIFPFSTQTVTFKTLTHGPRRAA